MQSGKSYVKWFPFRFGIARSGKEEGEVEMAVTCREHEKAVRNLKARVSATTLYLMCVNTPVTHSYPSLYR